MKRLTGKRRTGHRPRISPRWQLVIFCGFAAVTFLVLSVGAVFACRSVARGQALADAEQTTSKLADYVVGPLLTAAERPGSAEQQVLDRMIADRVRDGYLTEVMAWDTHGKIVWANEPQDLGRVIAVPSQVITAVSNGTISSDVDTHPEVTFPGETLAPEGYVEVYVPFPDGEHPALAFEAYYNYAKVDDTANRLTRQMLPLVLVPLGLLQVIQVPIATSLTRRVRRQEAERSVLLERNLTISERERVRIAADLHDGPIQDLTGIGYALGAMAPELPQQHQELMSTVQDVVRRGTESLRRMMVDLYPPDLQAEQLPYTIASLAVPLRERGIAVEVNVEPIPPLNGDTVTALYRIAREALNNVVKHANATHVDIILKMSAPDRQHRCTVHLEINDNGIGIDPQRLDRRAEGHLGLLLLMDRVKDLGGRLTITAAPAGGTDLEAVLPVTQTLPVSTVSVE